MIESMTGPNHTAEQALIAQLRIEDDGGAYWRESPGGGVAAGVRVGTVHQTGYTYVGYRGRRFLLHRLIFLARHGYLPRQVDHIDGDPANNRVGNLRAATPTQNARNRKRPATNTSGVKNVCWHRQNRRWQVKLRVDGKGVSFGCFATLEEAAAAAEQARADTFGEFARHA